MTGKITQNIPTGAGSLLKNGTDTSSPNPNNNSAQPNDSQNGDEKSKKITNQRTSSRISKFKFTDEQIKKALEKPSAKEAAKDLGIHPDTLYKYLRNNKIKRPRYWLTSGSYSSDVAELAKLGLEQRLKKRGVTGNAAQQKTSTATSSTTSISSSQETKENSNNNNSTQAQGNQAVLNSPPTNSSSQKNQGSQQSQTSQQQSHEPFRSLSELASSLSQALKSAQEKLGIPEEGNLFEIPFP